MKVTRIDGGQHHIVGVQPTHPVERTLAGIRAGRDEELEVALDLVRHALKRKCMTAAASARATRTVAVGVLRRKIMTREAEKLLEVAATLPPAEHAELVVRLLDSTETGLLHQP
jgi:hypothetical protein